MRFFVSDKLCYLLILFVYFTCFCLTTSDSKHCFLSYGWAVYIYNGISNSTIGVHVKSGDNDLGFLNITHPLGCNFNFCENIFHTTLFAGDFSYGSKFVHFNVFDQEIATIIVGSSNHNTPIYWLLAGDGYY